MTSTGMVNQQLLERELLRLNYCRKTLSAMAGDDTIFVVLDDRYDVWMDESRQPIENLIKVVPYFWHVEQINHAYVNANWYEKLIRKVAQKYDLDICLALQVRDLKQIHEQFFSEFDSKPEELKDAKFYIRKMRREVFSGAVVVSFENLVPSEVDLAQTFEGQSCQRMGLARVDKISTYEGSAQRLVLSADDCDVSDQFPGCTLLSALWFYFSVLFQSQLPLEPFKLSQGRITTSGEARVKELLLASLDCPEFKKYREVFQEKEKKIAERKEEQNERESEPRDNPALLENESSKRRKTD